MSEIDPRLKQHVDAIETLEAEGREIRQAIKERYASAKSDGYDPKVLKAVIAKRRKDPEDVDEFETLVEVYEAALGPFVTTPLGKAALRVVKA